MPGGIVVDSTAVGDYSQPPQPAPVGMGVHDIPVVTPVVPVPTIVDGRPQ